MKNYIKLIEAAQAGELVLESFKDAKAKFSADADEAQVSEYLEKFKELAKRNIVKGQDKDIGKWIKAGWEEFSQFVDSVSSKTSKRQMKIQQKKESIVIYEDEEKMLVIPLSEEASCYYGKNTQWCTAATQTENYFVEYFIEKEIALVYALFKNGDKYAIAMHDDSDVVEAFNAEDHSISAEEFEQAVGIGVSEIRKAVDKVSDRIEKVREEHSPEFQLRKFAEQYRNGTLEDALVLVGAIEEYMTEERIDDTDLIYKVSKNNELVMDLGLYEFKHDEMFDRIHEVLEDFDLDAHVDTDDAIQNFKSDANPVYEQLVIAHIRESFGDEEVDDEAIKDMSDRDILLYLDEIVEEFDDELGSLLQRVSSDALRDAMEVQYYDAANEFIDDVMLNLQASKVKDVDWYTHIQTAPYVVIKPENILKHVDFLIDEIDEDGLFEHRDHKMDEVNFDGLYDDDTYNSFLDEALMDLDSETVRKFYKQREEEQNNQ